MRNGPFFFNLGSAHRCHHLGSDGILVRKG